MPLRFFSTVVLLYICEQMAFSRWCALGGALAGACFGGVVLSTHSSLVRVAGFGFWGGG